MWSTARIGVTLACVCAGLWTLYHWSAILFTALYQHVLYPRRLKRRYDPHALPRCTVIVPCKGTPPHVESNLLAYLRQDYPAYEVIYAVEAESDPAVPIIRELIAQDGRASLVVAGLAATCAQKTHNQLAAIARARSPEVLVFADSDIGPALGWLRQLVLPLSDPAVSITTGYCWMRGQDAGLGGMAHRYARMFFYVLFTWMAYWIGVGLWGGTMAMRKGDFDALGVAARWKESVVDDMSLSQIIVRRKGKSVLVPLCMTPSDDVLSTFGGFVDWFVRQIMYVKAYQPGLWRTCMALALGGVAVYALLPVTILGALLTQGSFWAWGGGAWLILFLGEMLAVLLYALLVPVQNLPWISLLAPLLRLGQIIGILKTAGTRTITWGRVRYTFDGSGRVVRVER